MSNRRIAQFVPLLAMVAVVVLFAGVAHACPTCKEAVADNSPGGAQGATAGGDAASGFNNAIYLALGVVFSIIGGLGWKVVRAVSRADA